MPVRTPAVLLPVIVAIAFQAAPAAGAPVAVATEIWIDNFSVPGSVAGRYSPAWGDIPIRIGRYFSPDTAWSRHQSLITQKFTEGTIEVTTGAVKTIAVEGHPKFACSGLAVKTVGKDHIRLRLGGYQLATVEGAIGGKPFGPHSKAFPIEVGRAYRMKATLGGGRLKVWVDGRQFFDLACPISPAPGRTGLYCESPTWYDNYRVTGVVANPRTTGLSGRARIETVYARFRADLPEPRETLSVHGAIDLFIRNTGDGPAQLRSIDMNGAPVTFETQSGSVVWYEQRPWRIAPGEVGQILLRMRGLPAKMGEAVMAHPKARPRFGLNVHWEGGVSKRFEIPFQGHVEPVQINFLAFSRDLRRLWVYAQNNDWIHRRRRTKITLDRVLVGGRDVTAKTTFGERSLAGHVVPLVVDLDRPLDLRRHVAVAVRAKGGRWVGHCLRAIPSRTILQVTVFSQWLGDRYSLGPRADWLEDIHNHCANTVSLVGKYYKHLPRAKKMGMWSGGFGSFVRGLAAWARPWDDPRYPTIVGLWMDEVDKRTPYWVFVRWREMQDWQRRGGKRPPLHIQNVMFAQSPAAMGFMEMSDATMQATGLGQGSGGLAGAFGRPESLPYREHRRARRPFFPYFRNAEIYPHVDPKTNTTRKLKGRYVRCLSPREERWMYYGALLQGAKGVFHWGYSGIRDKSGYGGDSLRLGLGGAGTGRLWRYTIRPEQVRMLQDVWDEIGRCNAEWRAIAPLIAISDVDTRAKVTSCRPARDPTGKPAAGASALIAGLDAMVVVVLNHNVKRTSLADPKVAAFTPTKATVEVRLPPWLAKPAHVFRLTHEGLTDLKPRRLSGNVLRFATTVTVNDLIVITREPDTKRRIRATLTGMQKNLRRAQTSKPVHTDDPSPF